MPHCQIHGEVPCPICSGQAGAKKAKEVMTPAHRKARAKKAAATRWAQKNKRKD